MTAIVLFPGEEATFKDDRWESKNKEFQTQLNSLLDPDGPSGSDPTPHVTEAHKAIAVFGGQIVFAEKPEFNPEVIY